MIFEFVGLLRLLVGGKTLWRDAFTLDRGDCLLRLLLESLARRSRATMALSILLLSFFSSAKTCLIFMAPRGSYVTL